jgi:uncharacterized membrane protein
LTMVIGLWVLYRMMRGVAQLMNQQAMLFD